MPLVSRRGRAATLFNTRACFFTNRGSRRSTISSVQVARPYRLRIALPRASRDGRTRACWDSAARPPSRPEGIACRRRDKGRASPAPACRPNYNALRNVTLNIKKANEYYYEKTQTHTPGAI